MWKETCVTFGRSPPLPDPAAGGVPDTGRGRISRSLSGSLSGTNLERAGDYNLRAVLQAIRLATSTTRVEIVQQTGLTAPAIANITSRLSAMGLVEQAGRTQGGRGQPALRFRIIPDGAFGVGLNIDRDHLTLVTLDLSGEVRSRVTREIAFAMPDDVRRFVSEELDGALSRGKIIASRVLGIGVAMPDDLGRITLPHQPAGYDIWNDLDIAEMFSGLPWPVHCDNDAAVAALGEAQYGTAFDNPSFFYLLVSAGLGGGPVINRTYYRGATARSGEIGLMPDPGGAHSGTTVQDTVSLSALLARLEEAGLDGQIATLASDDPRVEAVVSRWMDDSVRALTAPLVAICCLFDPNAILIGGRLPVPLIGVLADRLSDALARQPLPSRARIMPAVMAQDAPAVGAAILPFVDHLLPSDAILIKAHRP